MERGGLARWLLLGAAAFFIYTFLSGSFGGGETRFAPVRPESELAPPQRASEQLCDLWDSKFHAQFSTRGASLKHFWLVTAKYRHAGHDGASGPIDLSTTPNVVLGGREDIGDLLQQLRFDWRNQAAESPAVPWQVAYDSIDWVLVKADGKRCEFRFRDENVELVKTVSTTDHPYELAARASIKNLAADKRRHALAINTVAWRYASEVEGHMLRQSPFTSKVECVGKNGHADRLLETDFEPDDFNDAALFPHNPLSRGDWFQAANEPALAAVSNFYFAHALIAEPGAASAPTCQLQIWERWNSQLHKKKSQDPQAGAIYRARLAYAPVDLEPGTSAEYSVLSYIGPKEREALAQAAGGGRNVSELLDLGFFSVIAKVLVAFLLKVHGIFHNWGVAIILLTITARTLLFPMSLPSIKSMLRMRELKPEIDALNEKFKDDAQAKGLAQMELWRKHNINPLKGCLPQMASMPVWFALYTTLQTAVELYNIPFLWFPDLSAPDPLYILPFIIGITSFVQQKLMPMQGDPAQQKMMLYFMPAMFTVFMLFLPAGLGVYMFTNGVLGIVQQQLVERHVRRTTQRAAGAAAKTINEEPAPRAGKGKKQTSSPSDKEKLSGSGPLLGKGKA